MVGTRVAPDNNDVVVWKFDDSGTTFANSSTAGVYTHLQSDLTLTGTVLKQQPSPFAASGTNSCVRFIGNDSGSPRNTINGANAVEVQPPCSFSGWYFIRSYTPNSFNGMYWVKQNTAGVWSGVTFGQVEMQSRQYAGQNLAFDCFVSPVAGTGGNAIIPSDISIPLNTWAHVGLTYDGIVTTSYVNGNMANQVTNGSGFQNITYGGHGPWFFGAVPAGSGDPQETANSVCDFRIATVVRPQSYFQNIYQQAILNNSGQISVITTFYKMRAYDALQTSTPVYWVDTSVSYANAPASPSGAGLGPIEVMESWNLLNT
jgi:hypothetical protein